MNVMETMTKAELMKANTLVGKKLKAIRLSMGYTIEWIARNAEEFTPDEIIKIESGSTEVSQERYLLAMILGFTLIDISKLPPPPKSVRKPGKKKPVQTRSKSPTKKAHQ